MGVILGLIVGGAVVVYALSRGGGSTLGTFFGAATPTSGSLGGAPPSGVQGYQPPQGGPVSSTPAEQTSQFETQGIAAAGAAASPFTFGISAAVASVASAILGQHVARLKGATNENKAADQIVPSFDQFVQQMTSAYNTGQIDAPTFAQTVAQYDQQLYSSLRGLVGPPGTAWDDAVGQAGKCNKQCTVACCLYFSDLGVVLSLMRYVAVGDTSGRWNVGDPRLSGRTITAPKVYPSKYSTFTRNSYTITLK